MDSTEFCSNCKREIPSVNYVMHVSHCSRNLEICRECGEPVHVSLKDEHQKENHETTMCDLFRKDVIASKLESHKENSCLEKLVECTTCGIEVPFTKLNDHELYCRSRTERCNNCQKYVMVKDLESHVCKHYIGAEDKEVVTIPCEFCGQQISFADFAMHQEICIAAEDDVQIIGTSHSQPNRNYSIPVNREPSKERADKDVTSDGVGASEDEVVYALPCEFCNELCPSDKLHTHQSECLKATSNDISDDDDDDNHVEYFTHRQRPVRITMGPHWVFERTDPFHMNGMLLGSVFNAMITDLHRRHFGVRDDQSRPINFRSR